VEALNSTDLAVVGGGPAGAAAAITAARAGFRVLCYERGRLPRHKVCGEFVSAEALDLLRSLLGPQRTQAIVQHAPRIIGARIFLDGQVIRATLPHPAVSIARFDLDAELWSAAQEAGVETVAQTAVQSVGATAPFHIQTASGVVACGAVVNATGRWSNLRAAASAAPAGKKKWLGVKAHYHEADPPPTTDLYFFDGGYCGVQPVALAEDKSRSNRVNACAMVRADVASDLPSVFAKNVALRERSRAWTQLTEPVFTAPLVFRKPQALQDGMLCAGDAAGFVDPFVGDGISLALRSGTLAAESLLPFLRCETTLEQAAAAYQASYQRQLLSIFRASSGIRRLLRLPRPLRWPLLALLQRVPGLTQQLVQRTR
jgi:flavin-dependent dehydrogenase